MQSDVFDPVQVLGCSPEDVVPLMRGRVVTPGEVEGVALRTYRWRQHLHDPRSYWVTVGQAAAILGRSRSDLDRLLLEHRVAYCVHADGVRLLRRHQVQLLARQLRGHRSLRGAS